MRLVSAESILYSYVVVGFKDFLFFFLPCIFFWKITEHLLFSSDFSVEFSCFFFKNFAESQQPTKITTFLLLLTFLQINILV